MTIIASRLVKCPCHHQRWWRVFRDLQRVFCVLCTCPRRSLCHLDLREPPAFRMPLLESRRTWLVDNMGICQQVRVDDNLRWTSLLRNHILQRLGTRANSTWVDLPSTPSRRTVSGGPRSEFVWAPSMGVVDSTCFAGDAWMACVKLWWWP